MNYIFIVIIVAIVVYFCIINNVVQLFQIFSINKSIRKLKSVTNDLSEFCMEKILTKNETKIFAKQVKKDSIYGRKKIY